MQKTRSPRFPFIPLEQALAQTRTLREKFGDTPVRAFKAVKELGYDAMSGKANKVVAALNAYGLITIEKVENGRTIVVSPAGATLAEAPAAPGNLKALRLAALAPMPFRRLWHNRPGVTEEQLKALLLERQFTEQGAQRAARVYMANVRYARLEDPAFRASNDVPQPKRRQQQCVAEVRETGKTGASAAGVARKLQIPIGDDFAAIPVSMREEDFRLLMQTLRLWKKTLVAGGS